MENILFSVRIVAGHILWVVSFPLLGGLMVGVLFETVREVLRKRQVLGCLAVQKPAGTGAA